MTANPKRELGKSGFLALIWMGVIFITSCFVIGPKAFVRSVAQVAPGRISEEGFGHFWREWWWLFVKGYHVLEFLILALLLVLTLRRWYPGRAALAASFAAAISLAYAGLDEFHQTFVPARGGRLTDVAIDGIGITVGVFIGLILSNRRGRVD